MSDFRPESDCVLLTEDECLAAGGFYAGDGVACGGVDCDPVEEVTVVPGATEGIFCAIMATVRTGDEVIVPAYTFIANAQLIEISSNS